MIARFRVRCRLDLASREQDATVAIDRKTNLVRVRPLRRRKFWELPLDQVVEVAVRRAIAAEVFKSKMERGKARAEKRKKTSAERAFRARLKRKARG